jgi:hypothetical protein
MILAAIAALILGISGASAETHQYRAPAHNYRQNNWMAAAEPAAKSTGAFHATEHDHPEWNAQSA